MSRWAHDGMAQPQDCLLPCGCCMVLGIENTRGWRSQPAAHAPNMAWCCTWRTAVECVSPHCRDDARSVACGGVRS